MTGADRRTSAVLSASVHFYPDTRYSQCLYPADRRATVRLGDSDGGVTLFADRADLARLRDLLTETVAQLDAASGSTAV